MPAADNQASPDDPDTMGMVFPNSDSAYLNESDLGGCSVEQLRVARNEIYARHGRMFTDPMLQNYFDQCPWYHGSVPADSFSETVLNDYELYNRNFIVTYEEKMGY